MTPAPIATMLRPGALPVTKQQWEKDAGRSELQVSDNLLYKLPQLGSGSKLEFENWLRLRVLWKVKDRHRPTHADIFGNGHDDMAKTSETDLKSLPWYDALQKDSESPKDWHGLSDWKESVLSLKRRAVILEEEMDAKGQSTQAPPVWEDLVRAIIEPDPSLVIRSQQASSASQGSRKSSGDSQHGVQYDSHDEGSDRGSITSGNSGNSGNSGSSGSSYQEVLNAMVRTRPPGEDEVNTSFLSLLRGLCIHYDKVYGKIRWSPYRKAFSVTQPKGAADVKLITAITDGYLQLIQPSKLDEDCPSLAIIEVKARRRDKATFRNIQMQEGAEMAAWISTQPESGRLRGSSDNSFRRILLSQDFDHVYITIAEYDTKYIEYITGKKSITPAQEPPASPTPSRFSTASSVSANVPKGKGMDHQPRSSGQSVELAIRKTRQGASSNKASHAEKTPSPDPAPDRRTPPGAPTKARDDDDDEDLNQPFEPAFLTMTQYKPFDVTNRQHMEELMVLLSLMRELHNPHQLLAMQK